MSNIARKALSNLIKGFRSAQVRSLRHDQMDEFLLLMADKLQEILDDDKRNPEPLVLVEKEIPYLKGRELFAAHAFQAFLTKAESFEQARDAVGAAIEIADEMIRQLEATKP